MNKILAYIMILSLYPSRVLAVLSESELKNALIPDSSSAVLSGNTAGESGQGYLDSILEFTRDTIFALMAVIAVGVFLYTGARLAFATGNPEQMGKLWQRVIYAGVGLVVVAAAWAIVRMVAGIDI